MEQWIFPVQWTERKHEYRDEPTKIHRKCVEHQKKEVARPTASFPTVDLKKYHIAEKTIHLIQVNHMIEKPKTVEENLMEPEFNFMVALKFLVCKTSVDPKLLQLKICLRNNQREQTPKELSPVLTELTNRFGLLFVGDNIVITEKLEKRSATWTTRLDKNSSRE